MFSGGLKATEHMAFFAATCAVFAQDFLNVEKTAVNQCHLLKK